MAALWLGCVAPGAAQVIFSENFDRYTRTQSYTESDLDLDWNTPVWEDGVREGRVEIVTGDKAYGGRGASLAIHYPRGSVGPKQGGAQWKLDFAASQPTPSPPYRTVRLRYRLKFGEGFDFARGGKLPGLAGGTAPTGSKPADGRNGWTARLMWRTTFVDDRESSTNIVQYFKHPTSGFDEDGKQEDNLYWNVDGVPVELESGRWYNVTQLVKMNTPGLKNGRIKVWLNGTQVLNEKRLVMRTTNSLGIDLLYFSTFFGGSDSSWAPTNDEVIYFDEFEVTVRSP